MIKKSKNTCQYFLITIIYSFIFSVMCLLVIGCIVLGCHGTWSFVFTGLLFPYVHFSFYSDQIRFIPYNVSNKFWSLVPFDPNFVTLTFSLCITFFLNIHEVKRNDNTNNSMPCGQLSSFSFTDDLLDWETTKSVVIIAISELNFIVRLAIMTMLL